MTVAPLWFQTLFISCQDQNKSLVTKSCPCPQASFLPILPQCSQSDTSKTLIWSHFIALLKNLDVELRWWFSGQESTCRCRRHEFSPWSGRIPPPTEQRSPEPQLLSPNSVTRGAPAVRDPAPCPAHHSDRKPVRGDKDSVPPVIDWRTPGLAPPRRHNVVRLLRVSGKALHEAPYPLPRASFSRLTPRTREEPQPTLTLFSSHLHYLRLL